ncbi:Uncharacterized protein TCAP_04640 [Tolypocladium capitatum]|uniref:Transmembrane protein n=1 Tax=Tolypocladium capitatum TaxID=45235 RepID=A0A2K3QD03_9HYPO|nr:Uncharacterized protein TCAP_04640 [Tolypocladium capitatum]
MRCGGLYGAAAVLAAVLARPAAYGTHGEAIVTLNGPTKNAETVDRPHKIVPVPGGDDFIPSTQVPDIEDELQVPFHELDDRVIAKELPMADLLDGRPPPPTPLSECASIRCVWAYLARRVKQAASKLGGEVAELNAFIAHAHDDTLPTPTDDDDDDDDDDVADFEGEWEWVDEYPPTPDDEDAWRKANEYSCRFHPRQPPLLMTIALAAIAVGSFSLWGIHYLHHRTIRLSAKTQREALPGTGQDQDGRRRRCYRPERRARRTAQRTAAGAFVAVLLSGWTTRREDEASDEEKRALRTRRTSEAEGQTTMEEEIAQLRVAASFVGDMVAAEEGRARQQQPQQQHPRQAPSYSGLVETYDADDEGLPPYDDVSNDSSFSVVADGFRHNPVGGSEHSQQGDDGLGHKE